MHMLLVSGAQECRTVGYAHAHGLILFDNYHLSLPAATPLHVWVIS
jgi:hypothetical protein